MTTLPRLLSCIFVGLLALAASLRADMADYHGKWVLDLPATMEHAKQSPKYKAEEAAMIEQSLASRAAIMSLQIDDAQVAIVIGKRTIPLPYTLQSEDATGTKVGFTIGEQSGVLTFSRVGEDRINFTSSLTDDMNFFVWQPAPETTPEG